MKRKNGAIVIVAWVIAVVTLSSAKNALHLRVHVVSFFQQDSLLQEKAIFRKEYKEKLDILESSITDTRREIKKKENRASTPIEQRTG